MKKIALFLLCAFAGAVMLVDGCRSSAVKTYIKNRAHADVTDERIAQGEALAEKYCQSCHMLPSPSLLDAYSWTEGVLPQMGPRLGIFEYMYKHYPNNAADPNVGRGYYPAAALLSPDEWGAIIDYYSAVSPDSLMAARSGETAAKRGGDRGEGSDGGRLFDVVAADRKDSGMPATMMVRFDTVTHRVLSADMLRHSLDSWDGGLRARGARSFAGAVVDVMRDSAGMVLCNIGAFGPNNAKGGFLERVKDGAGAALGDGARPGSGAGYSAGFGAGVGAGVDAGTGSARGSMPMPALTIVDSLMRPVNMASADLNGDGRKDIVVCEFGYVKGALCWLENMGGEHYERHVLRAVPGAIRVVIGDANGDGLPDIWTLFAQGDEALLLYTNKGHGEFEEKTVLRWPPSYGSTSFELDDFDNDGRADILYTCGDNGDFSTVLKPYHGIYIYRNEGDGKFVQRYFYPMNGCYRAMAGDFDGTGRKGVAAIAWFADYARHPDEGFVYLASRGGFVFEPVSVPETKVGRWMTMDLGDVNGDGKLDILLGNCSVGPTFIPPTIDWKKGPPVMLLRSRIFASK